MPQLTPADLNEWRRLLLEEGDGEFYDPTVAQAAMPRLMAEVEALWKERDSIRLEALREAAGLLEKRLGDVQTYGGSCPACRDAEARAFAGKLREANPAR